MAFLIGAHNKTYAQSWSELAESDAMWRIYAYNNRAVRIKVKRSKINLLSDVRAVPVKYSDAPFDCDSFDEETLYSCLAYKRTAFCHEKEVRLISTYKYQDEDDVQQHIKAVYIQYEHPERVQILDSMYPNLQFEEKLERITELLNLGDKCRKTKEISYVHIPDFVSGVMVHPLAPNWYVEVVQEFCKRNHISFEGKSALYS
jgi:hypothetical protein